MSPEDSPEKALPSEQCEHTHLQSLVVTCTALGGKLKAIPSVSRCDSWNSDSGSQLSLYCPVAN